MVEVPPAFEAEQDLKRLLGLLGTAVEGTDPKQRCMMTTLGDEVACGIQDGKQRVAGNSLTEEVCGFRRDDVTLQHVKPIVVRSNRSSRQGFVAEDRRDQDRTRVLKSDLPGSRLLEAFLNRALDDLNGRRSMRVS